MTKRAEQSRWLQVLRTTAHLAIAAMWFIALAAYLPDLLRLPLFTAIEPVKIPEYTTGSESIATPNAAFFVAAVGGLLILVLLFIVIKGFYIPATDKAVEHMTESAQKQILINLEKRQPKLPKKEKQRISRYIVELVYLLLITVPMAVLFIGQPIQTESIKLVSEFMLSLLALYSAICVATLVHRRVV